MADMAAVDDEIMKIYHEKGINEAFNLIHTLSDRPILYETIINILKDFGKKILEKPNLFYTITTYIR